MLSQVDAQKQVQRSEFGRLSLKAALWILILQGIRTFSYKKPRQTTLLILSAYIGENMIQMV